MSKQAHFGFMMFFLTLAIVGTRGFVADEIPWINLLMGLPTSLGLSAYCFLKWRD